MGDGGCDRRRWISMGWGQPHRVEEIGVDEVALGFVALLDESQCDGCRACLRSCNYGALIWVSADRMILADPWACTGCGACVTACARQALSLQARG